MALARTRRPSPSHSLYLGVDGGGTKTHIVLLDSEGRLRCEGTAGPSNPLRVGVETAVSNIISAINEACDHADLSRGDIVAGTLGLAGVRRKDLRQRVKDSFLSRLRPRSLEVVTDAEIAWFATTLDKPGIVVVAGTGSICFGKDAKGRIAIAGGWGPLAGDEGGGAGIARQALQAVAKASDGRGPATLLTKRASEYFRAAGPENLIVAIYSPHIDNLRIAGFAKHVVEAALKGDKIASDIIANGGHELGSAAAAVIKTLKLGKRKLPVGCVGSIFKAGTLIKEPLFEAIRPIAPAAYLAEPAISPAHAAAMMALRSVDKPNCN
jgi:N-acetylglucosamine kinase-like BadF-type ATPase